MPSNFFSNLHLSFDLRFFFVVFCIAVLGSWAFKRYYRLWKIMKISKPETTPGGFMKGIGERIYLVLRNVIGHGKLLKDKSQGIAHAMIFFGFIILTIGTGEHIIEGLVRGFSLKFLGSLYGYLTLAQDIAQWVVVAAVTWFMFRRVILKPARMQGNPAHHKDGMTVLYYTGAHMLADILTFTFLVYANDPHGMAAWRPLSSELATLIPNSLNAETATSIGWFFWSIHVLTVFLFLGYIPKSKHLHVFTAGPNIFLSRLGARGALSTINFEDETQTTFGVGKVNEFTWKDILDVFSCTACGRCVEFCPTATTGKPLKPMKLILDIKEYALAYSEKIAATPEGQEADVPKLISEETGISMDTVWACTTCAACVEACPVMIEHVDKIVDMRRSLVLMEGSMPAELQTSFTNWERQSNPWGMPQDSRDAWVQDLQVPRLADNPKAEYLFYVGCAGSFNDRNKGISTAFVKILQKAGVDFAILGKEELCNGETARRAGNEYLAKMMVDANIAVLKQYDVKKILTTCPHCFNSLKNEYPEFGFKAESVRHHSEFINDLLKQGRISVTQEAESTRIAFHDSCYLGRYNEIYEEPREALRAIGNVEVVEMPRNRSKGMCCGAGGARMWMEETIGKRINVERVEEALDQKPDVIAAGCPFCQVMLSDGVTEKKKEDNVAVKDLAEIIADRLA